MCVHYFTGLRKKPCSSCQIGPITEKAGSGSTYPGYCSALPTWELSGHLKRKRGPSCKPQRSSTSPIMKHDDDSALTLVLGTATPEKLRKAGEGRLGLRVVFLGSECGLGLHALGCGVWGRLGVYLVIGVMRLITGFIGDSR